MIFFNCRNKCRKIDCNEARQFTLGHAGYFEKIRNSQFHPQFYLTSELWKCRSLTNRYRDSDDDDYGGDMFSEIKATSSTLAQDPPSSIVKLD